MQTIDSLAAKLNSYLHDDQVARVKHAYFYAEQAHDGQKRRSGEPYITHPLAVANILADMHMDHQSLMAAMLHDVIEDTGIAKDALTGQFGEPVAELVDGVSKLTHITFESRAQQQAENFQKMALAMARDLRVILVKLADRLHNMRTLDVLNPAKRRRIARETLEIYAPIAQRLGMNELRIEFEDRGFSALYPMRAERLQAALNAARGNRKGMVDEIEEKIGYFLEQEQIQARVLGREKHLFSIYNKMRSKKKSFKEIMDVFAFRIVTDSVDNCYRTLGIMHNRFKPVPGEFKDYIAIPKANGYQSLHTVVLGMHGVPIEIQIRTEEMDAMANSGVAAHWLYKSSGSSGEQLDKLPTTSQTRAREWVKGLLELQQRAGNPLEFIENVKIDLFPDEIYVFTPKGEIIELPAGATAVDFAYAVHTDIGNTCVACRVNHRLAPLSEPLQSGQKVSIITAPGAQPNPGWLNFVITGKARAAIRHFLKNQRHHESIQLGKRLLGKVLGTLNTSLEEISAEQIDHLLQETGLDSFDDVLEDIGLGNRLPYAAAKILVPEQRTELSNASNAPLIIDNAEGLIISFAKCCRPIPGDPIVGHMSAGKGLVVHQEGCTNLQELRHKPEKILPISWSPDVTGEFLVNVRVEVENARGIVAMLATRITENDASIDKIDVAERDARTNIVKLTIGVHNRVHLASILRRLRNLHPVIKVHRVKK